MLQLLDVGRRTVPRLLVIILYGTEHEERYYDIHLVSLLPVTVSSTKVANN